MSEAESATQSVFLTKIVLPVGVGVLLAVVGGFLTFVVFPALWGEKSELSISQSGPVDYLEGLESVPLTVEVDGEPVSGVFGFTARVWNSGDRPLEDVEVVVAFEPVSSDFEILQVVHETDPRQAFPEWTTEAEEATVRKFTYSFLNPANADSISLLATEGAPMSVDANPLGATVRRVDPVLDAGRVSFLDRWAAVGIGLLALIGTAATAATATVANFLIRNTRRLIGVDDETPQQGE